MRAQKRKTILRDEDSEDSAIPDANEADASIPDGSTNPDGTTIPDASVTPDAANVITVDENFSSPVEPRQKSVDCSWEEAQRIDQQLQQDRMAESEKKRKAEEDHSAMKVYKKQKTRRTLSTALDTQEPGTQSVSDIHEVENVQSVAAAQGEIPDKSANPDEDAIPDKTANPDEGANPDKGATPDEEINPDKEATPDASTAAQVATQEPLTQSVKEGQATQEPPTQREGESLTEAGSGKFSYLPLFISRLSARMNISETSKKIPPLV